MASLGTCDGFDGNPDLYGLGIRLGVYLQWISSWIINTLAPENASDNHQENSIFVFAIVIAVLRAAVTSELRPVEGYIMLMICLGYIYTVLTNAGIRVLMLRSHRFGHFVDSLRAVWPQIAEKSRLTEVSEKPAPFLQTLSKKVLGQTFSISLNVLSSFKLNSLSWAGLSWRAMISAIVHSCYIWLLFYLIPDNLNSRDTSCPSYVFFFARITPVGGLLVLLKVFAILQAIPALYLFLIVLSQVLRFINTLLLPLLQLEFSSIGVSADLFQKNKSKLETGSQRALAFVLKAFGDLPENVLGNPTVGMSDILKGYAFVASHMPDPIDLPKESRKTRTRSDERFLKTVTVCMHTYIFLAVAWFLICIELTIFWNNISGVYDVRTTGQLIPLVIGVSNAVTAVHEMGLAIIREASTP